MTQTRYIAQIRGKEAFICSTCVQTCTFVSGNSINVCKTSGMECTARRSRRSSAPIRITPRAEATISETIERALDIKFEGRDIGRVSDCFRNAMQGDRLEVDKGTKQHQRATSYIEGLDAVPYSDDFGSDFKWVKHLEENWEVIAEELERVAAEKDIERKGNNVWAPPAVEAASTYGPEWRTLVLKDRVWDPTNTKLFPETSRILQDKEADVPAVEAFFARQSPKSGIKLHTDDCNFVLTMHLGLSVPKGKAWIEVAGERRYWEDGKSIVFNTSYYHQTMNESEEHDRLVLLIRFWHPQLSKDEREALGFLFEAIESPNSNATVMKAAEELRSEQKNGFTRSSRRSKTSGRGFGA